MSNFHIKRTQKGLSLLRPALKIGLKKTSARQLL